MHYVGAAVVDAVGDSVGQALGGEVCDEKKNELRT